MQSSLFLYPWRRQSNHCRLSKWFREATLLVQTVAAAAGKRNLPPPRLANDRHEQRYNANRSCTPHDCPALAVNKHHWHQRPNNDLSKADTRGQGNIIDRKRFVFRIDDSKQHEANSKNARRIAVAENGSLEPALVIHAGAERDHCQKYANEANNDLNKQRNRIVDNNLNIDHRNTEKYQIVCCCTGNSAVNVFIYIVVDWRVLEDQEENQAHNKGYSEIRRSRDKVDRDNL